jgi:hypothetical protein
MVIFLLSVIAVCLLAIKRGLRVAREKLRKQNLEDLRRWCEQYDATEKRKNKQEGEIQ